MAILHKTERANKKGKVLYSTIIALLCIGIPLQIFPFFWMVTNSIKADTDIIRIPPVFFPKELHFEGFGNTFAVYNLWNNIYNTMFLAVCVILVQMTISALAAFSLSKLKPKYGKLILLFFLGTMMISPQALIFPLYLMMANFPVLNISLINTKLSYILISSAWAWAIVLFKSFFDHLPSEVMESARIDGANNLTILFKIVLPLSASIFSVIALNTFIAVYNDFLMPLMLLPNEENWTLIVRVFQAQSSSNITPNNLYVLLVVTVIPVIIVYLFAQKQITQGIAMTGVKG